MVGAERPNLWGAVPDVVEMQSEGGAAGALHGALQAGALATTFTASQGLLLMLPNLFKIAGELNALCMHVAARSVATHALSIFGDHSDVMAARGTGMAMLASGSPQEAQDLAAIAHAATLRARVPFLHFFDGFRTSHEIQKIEVLDDAVLRCLVDDDDVAAHRARALSPDRPVIRGTAQNPDTFFQGREAANPFHDACPEVVEDAMDRFAELTGRRYRPFDYVGHPEAERVMVMMGSGAECAHETVDHWSPTARRWGWSRCVCTGLSPCASSSRPCPATVRAVAVLDRTKEPGSVGEPLLLDVTAALVDAVNGRRSRPCRGSSAAATACRRRSSTRRWRRPSSTNWPPSRPGPRFTVGITDDVTRLSLPRGRHVDTEPDEVRRAVFFGLGSDGTVSSNKASIKIIGESTPLQCQGHFVLRLEEGGRDHRLAPAFRARHDPLHLPDPPGRVRRGARPGSAGSPRRARSGRARRDGAGEPARRARRRLGPLPRRAQEALIERGCRLFVIDAFAVADRSGWVAGSTRSCRPASSPSLTCCPPRSRSPRSRNRSQATLGTTGPGDRPPQRRRDRRGVGPTARGRGPRNRQRRRPDPSHRARRTPLTSCSASPASCWKATATSCR